jgi:hypothetical protein
MHPPSKKEIEAELEKLRKLYECYSFLYSDADDESMRKKILELSRSHILAKVNALYYIVDIPARKKLDEMKNELSQTQR